MTHTLAMPAMQPVQLTQSDPNWPLACQHTTAPAMPASPGDGTPEGSDDAFIAPWVDPSLTIEMPKPATIQASRASTHNASTPSAGSYAQAHPGKALAPEPM